MRDVLIVGAGGLGRELLGWLRDSPDCGTSGEPVGFLDDDPTVAERDLPLPWRGKIDDFSADGSTMVVLALGNSAPRREVGQRLRELGAEFLTFVHPSVILGERVAIGEGSVICPRCVLTTDISLGQWCFLNLAVTVGHDVRMGDWVSVSSQVDLCGGVYVEDGAWMGSGARVIPSRVIGKDARVGAGSVVIRNVPAGATVFGNPAKRI